MRRNALALLGLWLTPGLLLAYPVGEMVPFDLGGANVAGVTSDGLKVAAYYYPWSGVVYWTEAEGLVTVDTDAEAGDISDDGRIFGSRLDTNLGHELPCWWDTNNTYHELPHLSYGQNSDNFFSNVWCCNSTGTVLGGLQWISTSHTTPVMWYQDGSGNWQVLDLFPEDSSRDGRINAVSEDGTQLAGWLASMDGAWVPTLWTVDENLNVSHTTVASPPDWVNGEVWAFSQNGQHMTGYMNGFGALWSADATAYEVVQPENPSFWMSITCTDVSNDGLVVGVTRDFGNGGQWGHVYKPGMGYMQADDWLNMFGVVHPEDYQYSDMIFWVSDDESMVMGSYITTGWQARTFVLALPELGHVEGTVTLNGNLGAVEDVLIQAASTGTHPDASGFYSLDIGAGTYDISASLPGYLSQTLSGVVVAEGATIQGQDFVLEQIPNAGFIEGTLTQIYNWDPFTQATITATDGNSQYVTHGTAAGSYQLILPAGTYEVQASQSNCYDVIVQNVLVVAEEVTPLDIEFLSVNAPSYIHLDLVVDSPETFDWSTVKIKVGNNSSVSQYDVWESSYSGEVWTAGTYTVSVWSLGHEIWTQDDVEFLQNQTTSLTIELQKNRYPVRQLSVASDGTASWDHPLPVNAYVQDHEQFQTGMDVTANIRYWYTPLWPNSNAFTTEDQAFEGTKSLRIDTVDGTPGDIYCDFGWPYPTVGSYVFEAALYVPSGHCAHHGIIREGVWGAMFAIEIFYRANGTVNIMIGGNELTLAYPQDQWFSFRLVADLDNDLVQYWQDGSLQASGAYSLDAYTGEQAVISLGSYDLSAESRPGFAEDGLFYMDNYLNYQNGGSPAATYSVSLDQALQTSGQSQTGHLFQNLNPGQAYSAGVVADYAWGASEEMLAGFTFIPPFGAPVNLSISVFGGNTVLSWDPVTDATGYRVWSSSNPYGGFSEDQSGSFDGESWSTPLAGGKRFFVVTAIGN
ncbi:MAG: carboxypeptidase regulatory-like domain-containing protein [Candidatus Cloacimonetes bacterium]|nr:carboxypeptidase regulatory-like domain-containing protein [Candidatus Cloacimonadota bacterium]